MRSQTASSVVFNRNLNLATASPHELSAYLRELRAAVVALRHETRCVTRHAGHDRYCDCADEARLQRDMLRVEMLEVAEAMAPGYHGE